VIRRLEGAGEERLHLLGRGAVAVEDIIGLLGHERGARRGFGPRGRGGRHIDVLFATLFVSPSATLFVTMPPPS